MYEGILDPEEIAGLPEGIDGLDFSELEYSPYGNDLAMYRLNLSLTPERRLLDMLGAASFIYHARQAMEGGVPKAP